MKLTTNFDLHEFIHPDIFVRIGERSADFLHPMLPVTCQEIKDMLDDTVTINNWKWGGKFESSGLRLPHGGVGAALSAHRFGTAADLKFKTRTPIEVQEMILDNHERFPYITRMENAEITKTWLHIEVGSRHGNIIVFNP